jgi:phage major head subunit gpT-like protein
MERVASGQRAIEGDDRAVATAYLEQGGTILTADGGGDMHSLNRRGDHADMLSGLVNKALARGAIVADTSFRQYSRRIGDLADFKPRAWIDHGIFNRLDAILEDEQMKQLKMQSELQTWIKADRYANCVGLTEEMVVDDDLNGFTEMLSSMSGAAVFTIQNAVIGLLVANPLTLDGNAFFSTAHGNIVTVGGVPSATELDKMRILHRLNKSYGSDAPMGATLDKVIVPATLENAALQTLATGVEVKTPATDATINTFRGSVGVVVDPYLDAFSTAAWYSIIPLEQGAGLIYAFQRGFGERGRRNEWYDASRKTRYVGLETRFGVALANWRAIVMNDGTP